MKTLTLAVEDTLTKAVVQRIADDFHVVIGQVFCRNGKTYLRSEMDAFCNIACRRPLLLLADLDKDQCAPAMVRAWLGRRKLPEHFIFRVAVREVESWLLADHEAIKKFFGIRAAKFFFENPDSLADPKRTLINLARHAPSKIRQEIVPAAGSVASQGIGYNEELSRFVETVWCPVRAEKLSESLRRMRECLQKL